MATGQRCSSFYFLSPSGLNSQWTFGPCTSRPSYAYPTQPPPPPVQTLNTYASLQNNIGNFSINFYRISDIFSNWVILQVAILLRAIVGSSIHIGRLHPVRANQFTCIFHCNFNGFRFHSGDNSNGQRRAQSNECLIITVGHSTIANSTKKLFIVYTTFVATVNSHLFSHIIILLEIF